MSPFQVSFLFLAGLLAASSLPCAASAQTSAEIVPGAVLPNGREIRPAGEWLQTAPYPFALAVRPDGRQIAIPSIGFPFALNVVNDPESLQPNVTRIPKGAGNQPGIEVHAGVAYSPDGTLLYVATGDSGKVAIYRVSDLANGGWSRSGELTLDGIASGKNWKHSFAATLVLSAGGRTLFVLDQGNWRVVAFNLSEGAGKTFRRIASIPTGRYPYSLALSPDGKRLYVTNTSLFEYTAIRNPNPTRPNAAHDGSDHDGSNDDPGLHFPPFGYPSRAAREGAIVEGKQVSGLGDENSVEGSSLWTYDISNPIHPAIIAKLRLGAAIGEEAGQTIGGAAPTGVAADSSAVYVALAHDDTVAKISPDGGTLLAQVELTPFHGRRFEDSKERPLRGVIPSGIGVNNGRVYVAESGINAVAVLNAASLTLIDHIPVGWNPSAVAFSPSGRFLYVTNAKGRGAGPNGGKNHPSNAPTYVGALDYGSLSILDLNSLPAPDALTKIVVEANLAAIVREPRLPHLKHCFLIVRENRTYDEVLGDIAGANGDSTLARFGLDGWTEEDKSVRHLRVTPNLHAIAARFAISDNFYVDSDVSADGHRWVVGADPTPFFNTAWSSGYGGRRNGDSEEPGRRAIFGGADAPMPEDEPQFGTLWEHIANAYKSGRGILNYGEGLEVEGSDERAGTFPEGQRLYLNSPVPVPVFESSDRNFPTFNLGIPDQLRFEEFKRDFNTRIAANEVPALIVIRLPNDHTTRPRRNDGYPYRASYVADNDLALGKIVEWLSTTPIWRDSALFVTEDDAQDGLDHVDAHRSILGIASPWIKPGSVSHSHTDFGSITRTIDELLGLGANNLEDALAGDLLDIFDTTPHMEPFTAVPADPRIFIPENARIAQPKTRKQAAELLDMDNAVEISRHMNKTRATLSKPAGGD